MNKEYKEFLISVILHMFLVLTVLVLYTIKIIPLLISLLLIILITILTNAKFIFSKDNAQHDNHEQEGKKK